ncbi:hypothetical protein TH61_06675 [Rufibacter sp. DG15C]|uniref:carboxypeptidase-like regulatory domain-containing protein n=1 Tax=Rufibacter sp. DG15C TaxID=1379909 RepID=UPI00078D113D|nr:carboxypeptidase-like regulatory domain-containing protein [Rufibacter sp. DG15C]AMM50931.1 hypothetical protein TH61_06675 [Rufibacter sp. DG15C]
MRTIFIIMLSMVYQLASAQIVTNIEGKIIDDKLHCLTGVVISNLKSGAKATSDQKGQFKIIASQGDSLEFRMVGFTTDKILIKDSSLPIKLIMADKEVNCLGAFWTERQYRVASRRMDRRMKKLYKQANGKDAWEQCFNQI